MIGSSSAIDFRGVIGRRVGLERLDLAVLADERRHARRQVQVGRLRLDHQPEQAIDGRGAGRPTRGARAAVPAVRGCRGCSGAGASRRRRSGAPAARRRRGSDCAGVRHDAHGDLRSVSQNRDFERAARRRVVEFDAGFLRQAAAGVLGNDRPDQLQDFLARQRMARRVLRRSRPHP